MWPVIGGLLSGGIGAISSMIGTEQNNQNALAMQQQQENYNTQMSNTAYQRSSADMKAAGLNPMMMFGSGSAASSPTAPPVSLQSSAQGVGSALQGGIATAVSMRTADATIDNLIQQNANLKAQKALTAADEGLRTIQQVKTGYEADNVKKTGKLLDEALPVAVNRAIEAQNVNAMDPTARKLLDIGGYAGRKASDIVDPVGNIASSALGVKRLFKPSRTTTETTREDGSSSFSERFVYH